MADREKLFDLMMRDPCPSPVICNPNCKYYKSHHCHAERYADHLISNGVTVRERGRWISDGELDEDGNGQYHCSVCSAGEKHNPRVDVPYCWKCGADMRTKGEGEEDGNET